MSLRLLGASLRMNGGAWLFDSGHGGPDVVREAVNVDGDW
jgi:hypothetical protein